jgi:signal transduction histidine kinase
MKAFWPELSPAAWRMGGLVFLANAPFLALLGIVYGADDASGGWAGNRWVFLALLAFMLSLQGLLVIWALSFRLEQRVTKSLQRVTRDAQSLLGVELPIDTSSTVAQDLEYIQKAFGLLLDRIRTQSSELATVREGVELQVKERTLQLATAKEMAEETARLKSQFLASISHELRTPLHAILSFSRFGIDRMDRVDREKLRDYFEHINDSGARLLILLDDLLDLAKLEAGKTEYRFEAHDLTQILDIVMAEFECLSVEKGCVFHLETAGRSWVRADHERMIQVMRNVLSNAIKFSPVGGGIGVWVGERDGAAIFEVCDEGPGVPEEDRDTIFEKFARGRNSSRNSKGTGLGLAICREIVSDHGGEISVRNGSGGGAVFTVSIPLYGADSGDELIDPAAGRDEVEVRS